MHQVGTSSLLTCLFMFMEVACVFFLNQWVKYQWKSLWMIKYEGCAVKRSCLIVFQAFASRDWRRRESLTTAVLYLFPLYLSILLCPFLWFHLLVYTRVLFISSSLFHPMSSFLCDFVLYSVSFFLYRPFSLLSSSVWSNMDNSRVQSNGYVCYFCLFASFLKHNKFLTSQWLIVFNLQDSLGRTLRGAQCNFCYFDKEKYRDVFRRGTSAVNSC